MPKSIYTHYVYRITNVLLNKHYYGSRSCKNCNPHDDLGIKYFSSSKDKDFIKDQKEHPEYYRYKIIKIFDSRKDALELEVLLHNKFDVDINESFYNKAKQTSTKFYYINKVKGKEHHLYGVKFSENRKKQMSEARKGEKNYFYGKRHSEETRKKIGEANKGEKHPLYGKHHSEEIKRKIGDSNRGKKLSEETKRKIGLTSKGRGKGIPKSEDHKKKISEANKGKAKSQEHRKKLSEANKGKTNNNQYLKHGCGKDNSSFKGYYITPFGKFASQKEAAKMGIRYGLVRYCKNNEVVVTKEAWAASKSLKELFSKNIIGKTYKELGFSFEAI